MKYLQPSLISVKRYPHDPTQTQPKGTERSCKMKSVTWRRWKERGEKKKAYRRRLERRYKVIYNVSIQQGVQNNLSTKVKNKRLKKEYVQTEEWNGKEVRPKPCGRLDETVNGGDSDNGGLSRRTEGGDGGWGPWGHWRRIRAPAPTAHNQPQ